MSSIVEIAIPCPLRQSFDYLSEHPCQFWQAGMRVQVNFRNKTVIGIVLAAREKTRESKSDKLKPIQSVIDSFSLIPDELFNLIQWVSAYYHHPIGDCFQAALPKKLRSGEKAELSQENWWLLSEQETEQKLGKKQKQIIDLLNDYPEGLGQSEINQVIGTSTSTLNSLYKKGLIDLEQRPKKPVPESNLILDFQLNEQQQSVINEILTRKDQFTPFLLDGVTGSGKTEVYIGLTEQALKENKQVLILIPEIGLTSQFVSRFQQRLNASIVILHSSISDNDRKQAWLLAREGLADVIIGTRSAIFTPLHNPGLIILDEEHDSSYKQQEGLRYHARNVALIRAQKLNIPILLGSATPSLESLYQVKQKRYQLLELTKRAGEAKIPKVRLIDSSQTDASHGLSQTLIHSIQLHLNQNNQVLLFINRRGYAPVLMCHDCNWQAHCDSCDARMVVHQQRNILFCHHCGLIKRLVVTCPDCGSANIKTYGAGTEKIEKVLQGFFPEIPVLRIDRDTTQRVNAFSDLIGNIKQGGARILVGTQMLAKGHDFHDVTLVGVLDADQGLYSADFRATETLAQLITQVTGRAGRGEKEGEVLIQTEQPQHPFWKSLIEQGYKQAAQAMLEQRQQMFMPPAGFWAVIRAEAKDADLAMQFLQDVLSQMNQSSQNQVMLLGPVPAIMERKAGRYRAQLLLTSQNRRALHQLLDQFIPAITGLKSSRKVRWSIDIDPTDLL